MEYFKFVYFGSFFSLKFTVYMLNMVTSYIIYYMDALEFQCLVADLYAAVKLPIKVSMYILYLIH